MLDTMSESNCEPCSFLSEVNFLDNLNELLNHGEKKEEEEIETDDKPITGRKKGLFLNSQGNELGQAMIDKSILNEHDQLRLKMIET